MANRPVPPAPPSFPSRLAYTAQGTEPNVWEAADKTVNEDQDEAELDMDDSELSEIGQGMTELLDAEFKADIKRLEVCVPPPPPI